MLPNLIQVEFFLVDIKSSRSLEVLILECHERIDDESPIKICFRFYDLDDKISILAKKIKIWTEKNGAFGERLLNEVSYPKFFNSLRIWWFGRKVLIWKAKLDQIVKQTVCDHLRLRKTIAIKCPDNSYRYVKKNERYELEGMVKKSTSNWIFIFAPNKLLSDKNKLVAEVM